MQPSIEFCSQVVSPGIFRQKQGELYKYMKSQIIENGFESSLDTISGETGITVKNLNRYLEYKEIQDLQNSFGNEQNGLDDKCF